MNEPTARIKINKLLEESGWRFFEDGDLAANISLEHKTTLNWLELDELGEDFQNTKTGKIDFLLLDDRGFPFIVLEAKSEKHDPLVGKEQARKYAESQNCRFVILSNGNLHYFWDLERGNPAIITKFPAPGSVLALTKRVPEPEQLSAEVVERDFIAATQRPNYKTDAGWTNLEQRDHYVQSNKLRFLRPYQLDAVRAVQRSASEGNDRFLFEMATGTGKTLVSAAVIKLFLKTRNAARVLFLVDRLELEDQARKAFNAYLSNDYTTVVYKTHRNDWRRAHIVVTTVQSLLFNNKYQQRFSPTDFDLVISDEAHRSIGGNARSVFEYFIGYKLGLTATPRQYLKNYDPENPTSRDPREYERRLLLDTYETFGCKSQEPTFSYTLTDGVKDNYLINPTVVDARTNITASLLSSDGFTVNVTDDTGEDQEETFKQRQFEKRFFSGSTNQVFCKAFLENGLRDPISGEFGKSIVFCVSQRHAGKITQILNQMADKMYPGKYNSDFAVQVTSIIPHAQQHTIDFANNTLLGSGNILEAYKTSKARVCVTVGMMTTGYDCPDILNLAMMRPIFSPTDFVQMKGRGTRKHNFEEELIDKETKPAISDTEKQTFKLFDFFANCQYFDEEFNYDQVIKLPANPSEPDPEEEKPAPPDEPEGIPGSYEHLGADIIASIEEQTIGPEGMKIDRMLFRKFEDDVREDPVIADAIANDNWDKAIEHITSEIFDKPEEYFNLEKLRKAANVDRRISLREILEKIFGHTSTFKTKADVLNEEWRKFIAIEKPSSVAGIDAMENFFKAYAEDPEFRRIIDEKEFSALGFYPGFTIDEFKAVPDHYKTRIPEYINTYLSPNEFVA